MKGTASLNLETVSGSNGKLNFALCFNSIFALKSVQSLCFFCFENSESCCKVKEFRRTQSALETTQLALKESQDRSSKNAGHQSAQDLNSVRHSLDSPCSFSCENDKNLTEATKATTKNASHRFLSDGDMPALSLKDSKIDSKATSSTESESDGDEQTRSRTPLLARHGSLEKGNEAKIKEPVNATEGVLGIRSQDKARNKRVSFSSRSLDDSDSNRNKNSGNKKKSGPRSVESLERRAKKRHSDSSMLRSNSSAPSGKTRKKREFTDNRKQDFGSKTEGYFSPELYRVSDIESEDGDEIKEKKFILVPQTESLVGWNQAGGPFTSQWLFQAVNVAANAKPFIGLPGSSNVDELEIGNFIFCIII